MASWMSLSISSDICAEDATLGDKMQHALQRSFKTLVTNTETQNVPTQLLGIHKWYLQT